MFHLRTHGASERRGFTLIELLIVILIISVLIAVGLAVGTRVIAGGKTSQTRDLLKTLDNVLNSYGQSTDRLPPAFILDPRESSGGASIGTRPAYFPLADGVGGDSGERINSIGLFLSEVTSVAGVSPLLDGLDAKNYREFAFTPAADLSTEPDASEPLLPTMFDAWGQPMRFVHPRFHGVVRDSVDFSDVEWLGPAPDNGVYFPGEFRRDPAMGDADGGLTTNSRPYFYSAGPDGDPSTIEDNVYLVEPKIQN